MANSASHASLPYIIKGARYTLTVPYLDADGDPTDPTTPDTEFSLDAGSFADCAEEVTTITGSNGVGYITLSGAETNGSMLAVVAKVASGPKNTVLTTNIRQLVSTGTGTLSAGSAGGGTLGTALGYDITGCFIKTTGGTGGGGTGGANNQARRIVTYTPSTGAFTVSPNWETTPDNTTTYDILLPDGMTLGALRALNPTTVGRTLDVSSGGEAGVDWANVGSPTTTLNLSGTTVKTSTDVETKVTDIQARLPAALVSGRIDASVGAMAANVMTAAAAAADLTTELQSGLATASALTSAASDITAVKAKTDNLPSDPADASDIASAFSTVNGTLSIIAGYIDTEVGAIKTKTDQLTFTVANQVDVNVVDWKGATAPAMTGDAYARLGSPAGASVSADIAAAKSDTGAIKTKTDNLPSDPADASDIASAFSTVNGTLSAIAGYIDTEVGAIKSVTDKLDTAVELDGAVYRFTTNALEQAPAGGGGGGGPTASQIADEVQTRTIAAVTVVNGLAANTLTASALASDAVAEIQSGLATSTALATAQADLDDIQTRLPAALVSGRMDASVGAMAANVMTAAAAAADLTTELQAGLATASALTSAASDITAVKAKTDNLPSDPADASDIASAFSTVNGTLTTIAGYIDTEVAAIKSDTAAILLDTGTDGVVVAAASKTGFRLSSAGVDDVLRTVLTEGYAADGAAFTLEQAMYMLWALWAERSITSTTLTAKKLDGSTTAMTFTLDDADTPTSQTRTT